MAGHRAALPTQSPAGAALNRPCPFCTLAGDRVVHDAVTAVAIRDSYPVSPAHTLVIPKRHVGSFFETTEAERDDLLLLLATARDAIERELRPAGYNVGINDGVAAGQTVPHLHIHLIPRFEGDQPDPRGGVRWVIPSKANYWNRE